MYIDCRDVIMGYSIENPNGYVLENIFLLYVKKYIYKCKMNVTMPNTVSCLNFMKYCVATVLLTSLHKNENEYGSLYNFFMEYTDV